MLSPICGQTCKKCLLHEIGELQLLLRRASRTDGSLCMPDDERVLLSSWPSELCFLLGKLCLALSMKLFKFLFPPPHCILGLGAYDTITASDS